MKQRVRNVLLTLLAVGLLSLPCLLLPGSVAWVGWSLVVGLGLPSLWIAALSTPWLPTSRAVLLRLPQLLPLTPEQHFCDLGAGDGRVVLHMAKATGATCVGLELSPFHCLVGWLRVGRKPRLEWFWRNWYHHHLGHFDGLYIWGTAYSVSTARMSRYLRQSLKPGCRVVSYHYPLLDWEPLRVEWMDNHPLYLYEQNAA